MVHAYGDSCGPEIIGPVIGKLVTSMFGLGHAVALAIGLQPVVAVAHAGDHAGEGLGALVGDERRR